MHVTEPACRPGRRHTSIGRRHAWIGRPGELSLQIEKRGSTTLVGLAGELDSVTTALAREALEEIAHDPPPRLVIDLSGLTFIDSAGIHLIVSEHFERWRDGVSELELRPGPPAVQRVFALASVEGQLPFSAPPA